MHGRTHIDLDDETPFAESYERLLPEFEALAREELVRINLEIPSAVVTTLGAHPRLRALRPRIVAELPGFDLARFDQLEDCARALGHAHARYLSATKPQDGLGTLVAEALVARETLLGDAMALARRGHIDPNRLKNLKGPNGYKNVATDLQILGSVLEERWADIQGKCAIEHDELVRAGKLAAAILRIVGQRAQAAARAPAAADMRVRAFTLFRRAYAQARRAAIYLASGDGNADSIAPSLYTKGKKGRRRGEEGTGGAKRDEGTSEGQGGGTGALSPSVQVDTMGEA